MIKKLVFSAIFCASLVGCATPPPAPTREDKEDVELLVSLIEGRGACDLSSSLVKVDDELLIRIIGSDVIKNGVPRATTPKQAEFFRLALESKTIPRGKDKEALINNLSMSDGKACQSAFFSFNNPKIRESLVRAYSRGIQTADDVRADKLTYEQIGQRMSQFDSRGYESMAGVLRADRGLAQRLGAALYPITDRMQTLFAWYEIDPSKLK
jgi:hypothetical protein